MTIWQNYPLIRLLFPFLMGIIYGIYTGASSIMWGWTALFLFFVLLLLTRTRLATHLRLNWIFGLTSNVAFFCVAVALVIGNTTKFQLDYHEKFEEKTEWLIARVNSDPIEKEKSYQIKLGIQGVWYDSAFKNANGQVVAYFERDTAAIFNLNYGQLIAVRPVFKSIQEPKNPSQFNYKNYMRFQGIYESGYVKSHNYIDLNVNTGAFLFQFAISLRKRFLSMLQKSGIGQSQLGVASALILGQKEHLDPKTIQSYASAGAIHVLAVSGLHVGILYLVLDFLLQWLGKRNKGSFIKTILLLLILWFYALLTGLSPSVLRATTMFSFVIIASGVNRKSNIYNTLAASVFFLLIIDPFLLLQVGFQLSYLAVIGIIYLQPKIYQKLHFKNQLLNYIWKISSVSIAAQIATFPLCLLYFHQFPIYFLLSNLVVIPLAGIILTLGLLVIATGSVSFISGIFGFVLNGTIWILNTIIMAIHFLPYNVIEGVHISGFECLLMYLLIILLIVMMEKKKLVPMYLSLLVMIGILSLDLLEDVNLRKHNKLCFYSTNGILALDCISGNEHVFLTDSLFYQNQKAMNFLLKNNWHNLDLKPEYFVDFRANARIENIPFSKHNSLVQFRGCLVYFLCKGNVEIPNQPIDVLYVEDFQLFMDQKRNIRANKIVFSADIREWELSKLSDDNFHSLRNGAYIFDLK